MHAPAASTIAMPWEPAAAVHRRDVRASVAAAWLFVAMTGVAVALALGTSWLLRAIG